MNPRPVGAWPGDDLVVNAIHHDSRRVTPGSLFVCVRGQRRDGHDVAADAVRAGASLVLGERESIPEVPRYLRVDDSRKALALLACHVHGHPSRRMPVVGVTGTNGKSSVTWMVEAIARAAGRNAAVLGTLGIGVPGRLRPQPFTTPEAPDLQAELAALAGAGVELVAAEISSHGLFQRRSYGTRFHTVVFTNLSQDHLDFHGTMEAYADAKSLLFRRGERGPEEPAANAVVRAEDPYLPRILAGSDDRVTTFGATADAAIRARNVEMRPEGLRLEVVHPLGVTELRTRLLGTFQVDNLLAAFGVGLSLGFAPETIARGLESVAGIPGRMERVDRGQPYLVVVDFAHTPDALLRAVESLRPFVHGRIHLVFGCGGDRDASKRFEMGRVATYVADRIIVTDDNPRSEEPRSIRAAVHEGVRSTGGSAIDQGDRERAIEEAIELAGSGDAVFIAGKGHETVQIRGQEVLPFDDREVAARMLDAKARRTGDWTLPEETR